MAEARITEFFGETQIREEVLDFMGLGSCMPREAWRLPSPEMLQKAPTLPLQLSLRMTTSIVLKKSMIFTLAILGFAGTWLRPKVIGVAFCWSQVPWRAPNFAFCTQGIKVQKNL